MNVPAWAAELPDDLKSSDVIKNTPDVATLARRVVDLDRYKGSSLALPKDGDEESFKAFEAAVTKRGFVRGEVPADPSGYEVDVDTAALGLGDEWKAARLKEFHAVGLTKAQAKAALSREVGGMKAAYDRLRKEHGEGAVAAIQRAASKYNLDGDPYALLNLLRELGATMTEDGTKPAAGGGGGGGKSVDELDAEIAAANDELLKLPEYDPRAKVLLQKKFELMKQRTAKMTGDQSVLGVSLEAATKMVGKS